MVININEFNPDVTELFIRFLYKGSVEVHSMQTLLELARMGKFYDILELQELCINLLNVLYLPSCQQPSKGHQPSVDDFIRADFSLKDLLGLGCDAKLLAAAGFSLEQFLEYDGINTPVDIRVLCRANFNSKDIGNLISCRTLRDRGWNWSDLAKFGYSMTELIEAGATPTFAIRMLRELEIIQRWRWAR